jgi:hypothetical protein
VEPRWVGPPTYGVPFWKRFITYLWIGLLDPPPPRRPLAQPVDDWY